MLVGRVEGAIELAVLFLLLPAADKGREKFVVDWDDDGRVALDDAKELAEAGRLSTRRAMTVGGSR